MGGPEGCLLEAGRGWLDRVGGHGGTGKLIDFRAWHPNRGALDCVGPPSLPSSFLHLLPFLFLHSFLYPPSFPSFLLFFIIPYLSLSFFLFFSICISCILPFLCLFYFIFFHVLLTLNFSSFCVLSILSLSLSLSLFLSLSLSLLSLCGLFP